ncbi:hypothetical protein [Dactylosporangium darangshiense]|uniref:hypothetical protein n=1 Tax=Dactylosporangium darangshiense TaxID=579108 RepID=UPI003644BAE9
MKSWPLRVKLVVLMLVLLAAALVTTGTAGVYSTRDYLLTRVDAQLLGSVGDAAMNCSSASNDLQHGLQPMPRNGFYVACINADTGAMTTLYFGRNATDQEPPTLPSTVDGLDSLAQLDNRVYGTYDTVSPTGGDGHQWRVLYAVTKVMTPPAPAAIAASSPWRWWSASASTRWTPPSHARSGRASRSAASCSWSWPWSRTSWFAPACAP